MCYLTEPLRINTHIKLFAASYISKAAPDNLFNIYISEVRYGRVPLIVTGLTDVISSSCSAVHIYPSPSIISLYKRSAEEGELNFNNTRQDCSSIFLSVNICCLQMQATHLFFVLQTAQKAQHEHGCLSQLYILSNDGNGSVRIASGIPRTQQLIATGHGWMLYLFLTN